MTDITAPVSDTGTNVTYTGPAAGAAILPANATSAQIDQYVKANYGYMAWALAVPELKNLLLSVIGPNGLTVSSDEFAGKVRSTAWYQNATQSMRAWQQLQGEDPKTAQAQLQKQQASIAKEAGLTGVSLAPDELNDMALQSIGYGWSTDEMDQALEAQAVKQTFAGTAQGGVGRAGTPIAGEDANPMAAVQGGEWNGPLKQITGDPFQGGTMGYYYGQVNALAAKYMVSVAPATAARYAIGLATNQLNPASVEGTMQKLALGKFPTLATEIQSGIAPQDYFAPIQQDIAKTLEIVPDQVNFSSPQFSQVLTYHDPSTGQTRPMTDSEAINWARSQPQYQNTSQANQAAATLVKTMTSDFGVAKYS